MPRRRTPSKTPVSKTPARSPTRSATEAEGQDWAEGANTNSVLQVCSPLQAQGPTISLTSTHRGGNTNDTDQSTFSLSEPDDAYEREAKRVADAVMRMPGPESTVDTQEKVPSDRIQRMCPRCQRRYRQGKPLNCEECEQQLQRTSDGVAEGGWAPVKQAAEATRGPGKPLSDRTRSFFHEQMDTDFSEVRIHTSGEADRAARLINARAYTLGTDIVFRAGEHRPETKEGRRLLAHELAHVVQQKDGAQNTDISRQEDDSKKPSEGSSTTGKGGGKAKKEKENGIDERVDAFVDDMNRRLNAIRKVYKKGKQRSQSVAAGAERVGGKSSKESSRTETDEGNSADAKAASVPALRVKKKPASRSLRTPMEQAQGVVEGNSWTCRSAHLAGNAQHVWLYIDGSISWNPVRDLKKKFNEAFYNKLVAVWSSMMAKHALKNYEGEDGWAPRDAYHLELPEGRVSGDLVMECIREYLRLTRKEGQSRNKEFEGYYATEIRKVQREAFKKAGGAVTKAVREASTSYLRTD